MYTYVAEATVVGAQIMLFVMLVTGRNVFKIFLQLTFGHLDGAL